MSDIATWRLYLLRAAYLLLVVGLGLTVWPTLLNHRLDWPLMNSVVVAMLCALSLLSLLGLRYPLQMLPLLLFELTWKALWLGFVAVPLLRAGSMDETTKSTMYECIAIVVMLPLIPWDYIYTNYIAKTGDRWRGKAKTSS